MTMRPVVGAMAGLLLSAIPAVPAGPPMAALDVRIPFPVDAARAMRMVER